MADERLRSAWLDLSSALKRGEADPMILVLVDEVMGKYTVASREEDGALRRLTSNARGIIELSLREALGRGSNYVDVEDIESALRRRAGS